MEDANPKSTVALAGHPLHPMLVPFPVAFLIGALVTDIVYTKTARIFWAEASTWLIGAGLTMAALAALAGLTDFLGERRIRALRPAWLHLVGNVVAVLLSVVNLLIRLAGDGAGVPSAGLALSAIVTVLLLFNGWMGWEMVYRHRVGVSDRP